MPLPQFEADMAEAEREAREAERDAEPRSAVLRFGFMKLVGEFSLPRGLSPGCGSKLVARTFRGTELGELLTVTCPNAGCGSSVSRQQMLDYIDRSGGRDYPFFGNGRVLRVATPEDVRAQRELDDQTHSLRKRAQSIADAQGPGVEVVSVEQILSRDRVTMYYMTEEKIDPRPIVGELGEVLGCKVEARQVGARDEARLNADYERCGQYCCCKSFLKVLKPVSMRSAKMQKATLDPLKISGRCGRLMCCLRYEDQTYMELKAKLPNRKSRVGTPEGVGIVLDSQILTQLVLVRLEGPEGRQIAVPVEQLCHPDEVPERPAPPPMPQRERPERRRRPDRRPAEGETVIETGEQGEGSPTKRKRRRRRRGRTGDRADRTGQEQSQDRPEGGPSDGPGQPGQGSDESRPRKKRRRRRRGRSGGGSGGAPEGGSGDTGGGE